MNRLACLLSSEHSGSIQSKISIMFSSINENSPTTQRVDNCTMGICGDRIDQQMGGLSGIVATLDGRIYNRSELLKLLHLNTDVSCITNAEIFIRLYKRFGFKKTMTLVNGDLCVQLYDSDAKILFVGRDRFGVKPIHYTKFGNIFACASRIQSLLSLKSSNNTPNILYQNIFGGSHYRVVDNRIDETPFKNIHRLPAAHFMQVDTNGDVKIEKYWSLEAVEFSTSNETDLAEQYRELFLRSVQNRVEAINGDTKAFLLSGGMDSSSVLASATLFEDKRQIAYTSVYGDPEFDERDDVCDMLPGHVSKWHAINIENDIDVLGLIDDMVTLHDEPVITATWLSHYLVTEKAAEADVKVLFGGLGGDELNAGEYEYFPFVFADLQRQGKEKELKIEIDAWIKNHDHPVFKKTPEIAYELINRLTSKDNPGICLPDQQRLQRYHDTLSDPTVLSSETPLMESPYTDCLRNRTYQDLTRETTSCCLRAEDRHASAFGMENINPFLDYELTEFMFRNPTELKIRNGVTKYLLRKAMKGILPENTRNRVNKRGWNAPAHQWFSTKKAKGQLQDMIHSQDFREWGIYDHKRVSEIIAEHNEIVSSGASKENHMMFIWQLCNLYLWKKRYT